MSVRVRDLPERPVHGVLLICPDCARTAISATRGDYSSLKPDDVLCCGNEEHGWVELRLVLEIAKYETLGVPARGRWVAS